MEALMTSGSRRETRSENIQCKKIGCMSGVFHLLHSPSRKRLTSGKKHEKAVTSSRKSKTSSKTKSLAKTPGTKNESKPIAAPENLPSGVDFRRFSCDLPRSPTLPPEIRRSKSINSPENHHHRRSPALVARLMGLDDFPAPDTAADKRRKLLGALERCDEDLKALKKVIEAVRVTWDRRKSTEENRGESGSEIGESRPGSGGDGRPKSRAGLGSLDCLDSPIREKRCLDVNSEQPSPVSVLDGAIFSPVRNRSNTLEKGNEYKKLKDEGMNRPFFERAATKSLLPRMGHQKGDKLFEYFGLITPNPKGWCRSLLSGSRGMEESVSEVCKEGLGEERWEVRRVGLVLEGNIFGELVEEMVRELGLFHKLCPSPFLDACRKRLIL